MKTSIEKKHQEHTFIDVNGRTVRQVDLRPTPLQKKYFLDEQGELLPIWHAARFAPKSLLLYVGFGKPQEHLVANLCTGVVRRWQGQDTGVYSMQIAPDGKHAYASAGGNNKIRVYDVDGQHLTETDPIVLPPQTPDGKPPNLYPAGFSISADGKSMYVADNLGDAMSIIVPT